MITDSQNKMSRGKIDEALELLNEAARDKKDEFKDMLTDKYAHIKQAITVDTQKAKSLVKDVMVEGEEKIKQVVVNVDERVRKDPWAYVAGTAAVALVLGFLMGSKRK